MPGPITNVSVPVAMAFAVLFGTLLALKGLLANSLALTTIGTAIGIFGVYNWVKWHRAGIRDRREK